MRGGPRHSPKHPPPGSDTRPRGSSYTVLHTSHQKKKQPGDEKREPLQNPCNVCICIPLAQVPVSQSQTNPRGLTNPCHPMLPSFPPCSDGNRNPFLSNAS
ncbi:hypothetical protein B0T18DRAFT_117832 [Schizothecium vesticola]|uniref:Uncharacterized protein n=1 Tax=Schizothecium vesticola TaxID=314040 RepID=A0AA40F2X1_9PEZI|nr:hypothetical protein B0T18DRAFT_117832 [Schizothecium vesticola]